MVENYQCRRISWTLLSRLSNVLLCFLSILFISISCKRGICWHSFCYQLPWFFLLSFWFGWLSMYSGVIFFFTSAPSYDGVMYAINLKCLNLCVVLMSSIWVWFQKSSSKQRKSFHQSIFQSGQLVLFMWN